MVCLLYSVYANLKYARRAGPSVQLARAYATNGVTAGLLGLHRLARTYSHEGPATARALDDPAALAWALELMSLYAVGVGDFDRAEAGLAEALELCARLGDWQHWGENQAALAQVAYYRGDARAGFDRWNALHKKATERGDPLQQAWGLKGRSEGLLRLGDEPAQGQIVEMLSAALKLFEDNVDRISQIGTYGLLAMAHLRREQFELAEEAAAGAMRLARLIGPPTGYYALRGYSGAAIVYLALLGGRPPAWRGLLESSGPQLLAARCAGTPASFPSGGPVRPALPRSASVMWWTSSGCPALLGAEHRGRPAAGHGLRRSACPF